MMESSLVPVITDYSDYWKVQAELIFALKKLGLKVDISDRLPVFRLWTIITKRVTGARQTYLLELLDSLVKLRTQGREPPNDGKKYSK